MKLDAAIKEQWPELANRSGVVLNHDNVRPHTSLATRQKFSEFECEVIAHSPYCTDLAPSWFFISGGLPNCGESSSIFFLASSKVSLIGY